MAGDRGGVLASPRSIGSCPSLPLEGRDRGWGSFRGSLMDPHPQPLPSRGRGAKHRRTYPAHPRPQNLSYPPSHSPALLRGRDERSAGGYRMKAGSLAFRWYEWIGSGQLSGPKCGGERAAPVLQPATTPTGRGRRGPLLRSKDVNPPIHRIQRASGHMGRSELLHFAVYRHTRQTSPHVAACTEPSPAGHQTVRHSITPTAPRHSPPARHSDRSRPRMHPRAPSARSSIAPA